MNEQLELFPHLFPTLPGCEESLLPVYTARALGTRDTAYMAAMRAWWSRPSDNLTVAA